MNGSADLSTWGQPGSKALVLILGLAALLLMFHAPVSSASAAEPDRTISEQAREIRADTATTRKLLQMDQKKLQARLDELKSSVTEQEAALNTKKSRFQELQDEESTLREKLTSEREEVEAVQGTLVAAAKNMNGLLTASPLGSGVQDQVDRLGQVVERKALPRMAEVEAVVEAAFSGLEQSGVISRYKGSYIDAGGQKQNGTLVRIGGISALYTSQEETGYLRAGGRGDALVAVPADLSWMLTRDLRAYIAGEQRQVPVDISKGSVFARLSQQRSWGEWIQAGGLLVWPLFGIAGLALILVLERVVFMLRIRSNSDRIMDRVMQLAAEDNWEGCRELCAGHARTPICRVMRKALNHVGETQQVVDNALQEGILGQLPRLERFLPTLSVLAAIAPLLGLLGTVTGMISTFQAITVFGTGEPKVMAGGISEALITTQLGLAVAVPIMFVHHLLDRRVDKIIGDMEEKGAAFSLLLQTKDRGGGSRKLEAPSRKGQAARGQL